ncbi:MAG TPA: helix-turn-helix transcriptional regulator [Gemmatimonadaceae bacterium]|jgi:transcriptional regulator with XRE-family HTH domain
MTKRQKQRLLEQLRTAIGKSLLSRYEIAKRSGVNEAALSRFVKGGSLTVETIERLAPVLGLELVLRKPSK